MHPGGLNVLLDEEVAGQDATKVFYSLHRHEVLLKPGYARLQIGTLEGESATIIAIQPGELSSVPYGEPTWLTKGYFSPYFNEVRMDRPPDVHTLMMYLQSHRALQKVFRKFVDEIIYPDAQMCEESGKRVSQSVVDAMA
jgi:hypothetical protein